MLCLIKCVNYSVSQNFSLLNKNSKKDRKETLISFACKRVKCFFVLFIEKKIASNISINYLAKKPKKRKNLSYLSLRHKTRRLSHLLASHSIQHVLNPHICVCSCARVDSKDLIHVYRSRVFLPKHNLDEIKRKT